VRGRAREFAELRGIDLTALTNRSQPAQRSDEESR
jgi:hypothetical protein